VILTLETYLDLFRVEEEVALAMRNAGGPGRVASQALAALGVGE
jgi:hypothetical protein